MKIARKSNNSPWGTSLLDACFSCHGPGNHHEDGEIMEDHKFKMDCINY